MWNRVFLAIFLTEICAAEITITSLDTAENHTEKILLPVGRILKPEWDKREYKGIVLKNGVKAILISDPTIQTAYGSITIGAGSMNDPEEFLGLAHLVEHLSLLGSTNFPESIENFFTSHWGGCNAAVFPDKTTYHFAIDPKYLRDALERFVDRIASPIFSNASIESGINALESEFNENLLKEDYRLFSVNMHTMNSSHPFSRFTAGNKKSLMENVHLKSMTIDEALRNFHQTFYSSNIITTAILGSEPLDVLHKMVDELFTRIPNHNIPLPSWPTSPLAENQLHEIIKVVPINDVVSILLNCPVPSGLGRYKADETDYYTSLINYKGNGSLTAVLEDFIISVSAEYKQETREFALFCVRFISYTDRVDKFEFILESFFKYLDIIKETGPQQWYWEQIARNHDLNYRYNNADNFDTNKFITTLSAEIMNFPLESAVISQLGVVQDKFEPMKLVQFLDFLTPNNCRVLILNNRFEFVNNSLEPWYEVEYTREKVSALWGNEKIGNLSVLDLGLQFPIHKKNRFEPTDFTIKERLKEFNDFPKIINESTISTVWFNQDNTFLIPKAYVKAELHSQEVNEDELQAMLSKVFKTLLGYTIEAVSLDAKEAGFDYSVETTENGLEIQVEGFNSKLDIYLQSVFSAIKNFNFTMDEMNQELRYEMSLLEKDKHYGSNDPFFYVSEAFTKLLTEKQWLNPSLVRLGHHAYYNPNELRKYLKEFFERLRVTWLFYGNLTPDETLSMSKSCEDILRQRENAFRVHLLAHEVIRQRAFILPQGSNYVYKVEDKKPSISCSVVLFPFGFETNRKSVLANILQQIMTTKAFNQLRTKEHLAYTAFTEILRQRGTIGIYIVVKSMKHPKFVESRINNFLVDFENFLGNMTEIEFQKYKNAVEVHYLRRHSSMKEKFQELWSQINSGSNNFKKSENEKALLKNIALKNVKDFFRENLSHKSETKRRLAIQVLSLQTNVSDPDFTLGTNTCPLKIKFPFPLPN